MSCVGLLVITFNMQPESNVDYNSRISIYYTVDAMAINYEVIYYSKFAKDHFFYSVLLLCICNTYEN